MTTRFVRRAAERKHQGAVKQTELQGAATPAPLPPEPEPLPTVVPLPDVAPKVPDSQPEPHAAPPPATAAWQGLFFTSGESIEEFNEFFERLDDHYMPYNPEERISVAKLAESRWSLHRRKRAVESIEAELYASTPGPATWTEADFKRLALADAYRLQAERVVFRAQQNVDAFIRERTEDSKWQSNFDLAERRLHLQKQKFAFALHESETRHKHIAPLFTKTAVAN